MTWKLTKPSDLEFAFVHDADEPQAVFVEMSVKADPEWDGGLSHLVSGFWPAHIPMDEVMENTFEFQQSEEEVKALLISAGFEFSESFQKELDDYENLMPPLQA